MKTQTRLWIAITIIFIASVIGIVRRWNDYPTYAPTQQIQCVK